MITDVNRLENAARLAMGHVAAAPQAPTVRRLPASIAIGIVGSACAALGMVLLLA